MKRRLLAHLLIAALPLAFGAIAAACDGDGELTLEEYFREIETIDDEADQRFEALDEDFGEEFASEEEQVDAFRDFFEGFLPILRDFVAALDDVDPPAEAEDAHEEAVASGAEFLEIAEGFTDQLADVESTSELEALFEDPEFEAADQRFTDACIAVQGIADDNGIDVDLECEEE